VSLLVAVAAMPCARAGDVRARVLDQDRHPAVNAVVLLKPQKEDAAARAKPADGIMDQIDEEFVPLVLPVAAGATVHFPNQDDIRHDVYSFSPAKTFELPLYSGRTAPGIVFDKPGVVVLGCNIHDWMIGYIYVADTPWFGKTAEQGMVKLDDIPAGEYYARVWHPGMSETEASTVQRISVPATGAVDVQWLLHLKPELRKRRAPVMHGGAYH
jgi:plastocyanin